jgi:hypothetical protein
LPIELCEVIVMSLTLPPAPLPRVGATSLPASPPSPALNSERAADEAVGANCLHLAAFAAAAERTASPPSPPSTMNSSPSEPEL